LPRHTRTSSLSVVCIRLSWLSTDDRIELDTD